MSNRSGWAVIVLVVYLAAPLRAEDQQGTPPAVEQLPSQPEPFKPMFEGQTVENTYLNAKGDQVVFAGQDGKVVTRGEFIEQSRALDEQIKRDSRAWVEGAVNATRQQQTRGELGVDDATADAVVSGTWESQRRFEEGIDHVAADSEAQARKLVPLKTLRSLEAGHPSSEQK